MAARAGRLVQKKLWSCAAIVAFGIAGLVLNSVPMTAQVSTETQNENCLEAKLMSFATTGRVNDPDNIVNALPSLTSFLVEVESRTFKGRLTCADPRPAFYNCGHTKQSVWGCKPDCFIEPDGSRYVLETQGKSYLVAGDPNHIRPFLADEVVVTGKLTGQTIKAMSIAKASKNVRITDTRSSEGMP